jgi:FixJ family two-component response regulator
MRHLEYVAVSNEWNHDVFIVDDDGEVRNALTRLLDGAGHRPRTFASGSEFLNSRCYLEPGCAVLDVRLPDYDGMQLYSELQNAGAIMPVIFLTGFGDISTSVRAIKSGAVDFLSKPVSADELIAAVDCALAAESRLRAERADLAELQACYDRLTPREHDILRLIMAGRLNKQIARELGISEKTVKVHRGRVMAKMHARRVAQLVQAVVRIRGSADPSSARGYADISLAPNVRGLLT